MLFEQRSRAESFGAVAPQYDRARPSYPASLVDELLCSGAQSVLDVGCGTGIASMLFAQRGLEVLGVEIDARMAEVARDKGLDVEVARFEDWCSRGRRFDLLVSGQAWHWVEPTAGALRAAELIREGGEIGLFWNFGDPPDGVRQLLDPIYARLGPKLDDHSALLGKRDDRAADACLGIAATGAFEPPEINAFPWTKRYDTASWLDQLVTHSDHQALPPDQLSDLLIAVGDAIDSIGGSFEMAYSTLLIKARRAKDRRAKPAAPIST